MLGTSVPSNRPGVQPTFAQYQRRRLGPATSEWQRIASMLRRSLSAPTFGEFWRYWNPLFSYYLYYRCYRPLVRHLPRAPAVVLTFAVSGAVHDFFASLAMRDAFIFCTPVFAVFGLYVVAEEGLGFRLVAAPTWLRSAYHLALIIGTVWIGQRLRGNW